jgi:hypothetical protein
MKTSLEAQLRRYDLVIWMESCAALGIYDGEGSNPCRFENVEQAIENGRLMKQLWSAHPKLMHVGAFTNLEDKIHAVKQITLSLTNQRT